MLETFTIYIDPFDDVVSVCEKINAHRSVRVLIVYPKKKRVLDDRMDLDLLNKHCQVMGCQLALVTFSNKVILNAVRIGIPVYQSLEEARRKPWRRTNERGLSRNKRDVDRKELIRYYQNKNRMVMSRSSWIRIPIFLMGIFSITGVILLFIPGATISLSPIFEKQELIFPVEGRTGMYEPVVFGILPVYKDEMMMEGSSTAVATGFITLPLEKAKGTLEVQNLTGQVVEVPAGTIVKTQDLIPVRFRTLEAVQLDPSPAGWIMLPIEAIEAGSSGNVEANSILSVEGEIGLFIAVNNPEALASGFGIQSSSVSADDIANLQQSIIRVLEEEIIESVNGFREEKIYLQDTLELKDINELRALPEEGQPAVNFDLSLNGQFTMLYFNRADLETISTILLDTNMPSGKVAQKDSLDFRLMDTIVQDEGRVQVVLEASQMIHPELYEGDLLSSVIGKRIKDARDIIMGSYPLRAAPGISVQPNFWPWVPVFPFRIQVDYVETNPGN